MKYITWLSFLFATLGWLVPLSAKAQVTPDGTTSTTVEQTDNNFTIEQGDRVGDNLFHSFDEFSVPTGGSAGFNNAADIANIFSRVTGGDISNIDGLLSASGTANLFLINPNGIIFGENARLDIGGSFYGSTADSLLFDADTEFSASNPEAAPLLEVSIPIGLSFRDNPGDIINRSIVQNSTEETVGLEVAPGKDITFIGGDLDFEGGNITASGGDINLGGLSQAGIVGLGEDSSLNFPEEITKSNIILSNLADIDVVGTGGGNIAIDAQNLSLVTGESGGGFIRAGITPESTNPEAQAGDITINVAENIGLDDSEIINQVAFEGVGNSGNITINTDSLELINGGSIEANTFGIGNGGAVEVTATGDITVDGEGSNLLDSAIDSSVGFFAEGNSGGVTISTNNLNLTTKGKVSANANGNGNAGAIRITAAGDITIDGEGSTLANGIDSGVDILGEGDSGGITISTTNLNLTAGGEVSASTSGIGNAGAVDITATGDITVDGEGSDGVFDLLSSITSRVDFNGEGDSGGITISTTNLNLSGGGRVDASTLDTGNAGAINITATGDITVDGKGSSSFDSGASSISSSIDSSVDFDAEGDSGGITISTTNLNLSEGAEIDASTGGSGNAGAIDITATGDITVNSKNSGGNSSFGSITSRVSGPGEGNSGGITISTTNLNLSEGAEIDASTFGTGNAGAVDITATGDITVDGEALIIFPSSITSIVRRGAEGDSEGITISTNNLNLTARGRVDASTFGTGNAGAITISATGDITIDGESSRGFPSGITSLVDTDAEGDAGGINISTTNLNLTNGGIVSASTFGQGNANNVTINTTDSIFISGEVERSRSQIAADAIVNNGDGGSVNISTDRLTIEDGGIIEAGNFDSLGELDPGTGLPGNISIRANSIDLERGSIEAATQSSIGDGANINLFSEDIVLNDNALISATAFEEANGGNLNIESGFILAFPDGNNDIIARADRGNGGQITIDTEAIFGLEERASEPANLTNDIDASSEFGLQGDFALNTPDFDPTTGLIELPASVSDASDQISQNPCQQGLGSQFVVTGKGGLPPSPASLNSSEVRVGLVDPLSGQGESTTGGFGDLETGRQGKNTAIEDVPAMGWVFNDKGEVTLTAHKTSDTEIKRSPQQASSSCSASLKARNKFKE